MILRALHMNYLDIGINSDKNGLLSLRCRCSLFCWKSSNFFSFLFFSFCSGFRWCYQKSHEEKAKQDVVRDIGNVVISLLLLLLFPFDIFNVHTYYDNYFWRTTLDILRSHDPFFSSNSCRSHKWKRTKNSSECNICHASITKINYTS